MTNQTADLEIPHSSDDLTPQWLTEALRSSGVVKDAAVTSFDGERLAVGQGFTGQITRLRLAYDRHEDGAPRSLIAKFPTTDPRVRANVNKRRAYECEVSFYRDVADHVELSTARCYYSASDVAAGDHVLLIEDLDFGRVGDNVAGCSDEDARLAVREIARFHASFWESPRLAELDWVSGIDDDAEGQQDEYRRRWDPFLEKVGGMLPPGLLEVGLRFRDNVADVKRQLGGPPRTIEHGDFRVDNLIFGASGVDAPLTVIDWQGVVHGRGVVDVAYLLEFGMEPEQRRATEMDLLKLYHATLLECGVGDYDFERCVHDYRLSILNHLDRLVGATARLDFLSSERGRMFVKTLVERFDSAMADHNVIELMRY